MKSLKTLIAIAIASTTLVSMAAEKSEAKPYTLDKCIVSDEKLGGDMGKPFVFVHEGQEIKLCCKSCQKDFKKDPTKYLKKLADAEKTDKKSDKK